MTLAEPLRRTLTILGPDDRPLAGVRLVPVLYAINGRASFITPDDCLEQMTVATGALCGHPVAYLPAAFDPLNVRVTSGWHGLTQPGASRINPEAIGTR